MLKVYLANGKNVFWAFTDFEKGYDSIDRHGMWQMLSECRELILLENGFLCRY